MADLDFNIPISGEEKQNAPPPQSINNEPAAKSSEGGFLSQSAHPVACVFHFAFKMLAFLCYLFLNAAMGNATLSFIVIITFAALDFWTVQNITGRLLVGLRWKNQVNEDGSEEWIFESLEEEAHANSMDKYMFWGVLLLSPVVWIVFFIANALTFSIFWSMCCLFNLILTGANLVGYWKCNKDYQKKLKGLLGAAAVMGKI